MANKYLDLLGTTLSSFGIGPKATRATLDTSAITAPRTHTLPDASGAVALLSQCATAAQGVKADAALPQAGGTVTGSIKSAIGTDSRSFSVPNVYGSGGANYGGVVNGLYTIFNAYYNGAWVQEDATKASGGYYYRADQNSHGFYSWPAGGALTTVVTIDSVGTISAEGTVRSTGAAPPSSGDGVELAYNGTGYLTSYDRTAGVYKPLNIRGSTTTIGAGGTDMLKVDTSSWYFKNANSTALTRQPRIFVQSTDPGAAAADGDIWIW